MNSSIAIASPIPVVVGSTAPFVICDKLRPGAFIDGVHVGDIGPGFTGHLLLKKEPSAPSKRLYVTHGVEVVLEELHSLGEICFSHLWELLKKQGDGGEGVLPVDRSQVIARCMGEREVPLIVTVRWEVIDIFDGRFHRAWCLDAYPPEVVDCRLGRNLTTISS